MSGGCERYITVPLHKQSQHKKILDTRIVAGQKWQKRILDQLLYAYRDAPNRNRVIDLVASVLESGEGQIGELAKQSVVEVAKYLNCDINVVWSSTIYDNSHLKGQDRIVAICKKEKATTYVNASGGRHLYEESDFAAEGIRLMFMQPLSAGKHGDASIRPNSLSIIDVLMHHSADDICQVLVSQKI